MDIELIETQKGSVLSKILDTYRVRQTILLTLDVLF